LAEEHMKQLATANPDITVQMPDGRTVRAGELPDALAAQMVAASKDSELFQTAVGCLLRTML